MSDKFTEVTTPSGGLGQWGNVDPEEAIAETRRWYEREARMVAAILADLDAGRVTVHHQRGPVAGTGRRQVYPPTEGA